MHHRPNRREPTLLDRHTRMLRPPTCPDRPPAVPQSMHAMKIVDKCTCEKPLLRERSEQKGSSESWCGRCKRPLALRPAGFRSAFA